MSNRTRALAGVFGAAVIGAIVQFATKGQYAGAGAAFYVLTAGASGGALIGLLAPLKKKRQAAQAKGARALDPLAAALEGLKAVPEEVRAGIPIDSLFESADRLRARVEALSALVKATDLHKLYVERERARGRGDVRELAGLDAHIKEAEQTEVALAETRARSRSLLHEVSALRVQLTTQTFDRALVDDACERLSGLLRKQSA